jgi:hypothetical protein
MKHLTIKIIVLASFFFGISFSHSLKPLMAQGIEEVAAVLEIVKIIDGLD